MKSILILIFCSISLFAQRSVEKFKSEKLGTTREISISIPQTYAFNPNKGYPLAIVLDGDYLFDPVVGTINYGSYFDNFPEMIIVVPVLIGEKADFPFIYMDLIYFIFFMKDIHDVKL